ncbi:hypothetical protein JYU34_019635 [Plutella xylostella]|uniref:Uncharacterized protein n=1 Tax=Plutella xylostella TaxID=51655 RepID=A0ABQ7PXH4_PLUXY|nr:hypothetical protein JYU34_019635 [Plutella xylostella]
MSKSFEAKSTWCWCKKPQQSAEPEYGDSVGSHVIIVDPAKIAYVQNWIDAHRRFFPSTAPPTPSRSQPKIQCNTSPYQYGRPEVNYFYTEPIDFSVRKDIKLPYIMKSPHPISPLRMLRK